MYSLTRHFKLHFNTCFAETHSSICMLYHPSLLKRHKNFKSLQIRWNATSYLSGQYKGHWWPALRWCHNACDGVANHLPHDCLLSCLFTRRSMKTSKLRVIGLCKGNSPVTSEFPAQRAITRKMCSFDDVIMATSKSELRCSWHSCSLPAIIRLSQAKLGLIRKRRHGDPFLCPSGLRDVHIAH